jgi:hypothetical protein
MPIDTTNETVVSLNEAAKGLPVRRGGKRPNVATLYRWTTIGCRGVRLEFVQVGATRCTSTEALQRFFDRLTAASETEPYAPVASRKANSKAVAAAEAVLNAAGI